MLEVKLSKRSLKFIKGIPAKHATQIGKRVLLLAQNTGEISSQELKGYAPYRRAKSGEYRIIYRIEDNILYITLLGKRNDDDIYRLVERFLK